MCCLSWVSVEQASRASIVAAKYPLLGSFGFLLRLWYHHNEKSWGSARVGLDKGAGARISSSYSIRVCGRWCLLIIHLVEQRIVNYLRSGHWVHENLNSASVSQSILPSEEKSC